MTGSLYLGGQKVCPVVIKGNSSTELPSYQVVNGVASRRSKVLDGTEFSNITSVGGLGLYSAFSRCSGLTGILNLSALTTIDSQGCYNAFQNCSGLTGVDLSALTTVGLYGLGDAFSGCSGLTTVRLPSLTSISSSGFSGTFRSCQNLTSVYFNSLKTTSFGNKNAFVNLMASTGKTVTHALHFPSNLTSTISGLNGYPLFGGKSGYVTLSFDLPATS